MASLYPYNPSAFDQDGFLKDFALWDENLARAIAQLDGIAFLTTAHLNILRNMRFHYLQYGTLPNMKHLCRECHLAGSDYHILFNHSSREAWRIAGLPNPGDEAQAYMS